MDALGFAAIVHLAEKAGATGISRYLTHPSHHPVTFLDEVDKHLAHIKNVEAFEDKHEASVSVAGSGRTYTQDEFLAAVKEAMAAAKKEAA